MSGIFATVGSKVSIGQVMSPQSTPFVLADFASQTWTPCGWTQSIGQFGDVSAEIKFDAIDQSRTQKLKGTRDAGSMDVAMGVDHTDPGQIALVAAEQTPYDYAVKVEFNDAASGGTPSARYFIAKVMSAAEKLDTANNVVMLNCTLAIDSNIVRVDAVP